MTEQDRRKRDPEPPSVAQSVGDAHAESGGVAGIISESTVHINSPITNIGHSQSLQDLAAKIGGRDAWQAYRLFASLDLETRGTLMNDDRFLSSEKARALLPVIADREGVHECAKVLFETNASRMVTLLQLDNEELRVNLLVGISNIIAAGGPGGLPERKLQYIVSADPAVAATIVELITHRSTSQDRDWGRKRATKILASMSDKGFLAYLPDTQAATTLLFSLPWHDEVAGILLSIDPAQTKHHLERATGSDAAYVVERAIRG